MSIDLILRRREISKNDWLTKRKFKEKFLEAKINIVMDVNFHKFQLQ